MGFWRAVIRLNLEPTFSSLMGPRLSGTLPDNTCKDVRLRTGVRVYTGCGQLHTHHCCCGFPSAMRSSAGCVASKEEPLGCEVRLIPRGFYLSFHKSEIDQKCCCRRGF